MKCPVCGADGLKDETRKHEVRHQGAGGLKTRTVDLYGSWCDACGKVILNGTEVVKAMSVWMDMQEEEAGDE